MLRNLFVLFLFISFGSTGQILEPAKWTSEVTNKEVSVGDEIELVRRDVVDVGVEIPIHFVRIHIETQRATHRTVVDRGALRRT